MTPASTSPESQDQTPGSLNGIVQVKGVHKSYGELAVLRGISFTVRPGERVALTGPSGSGKSTLLNCIGGIEPIDRGVITVAGTDLQTLDGDRLAALRRRTTGTVFQFFHLLPTLSAAENVEFPLRLLGMRRDARTARVAELLHRVGITHRAAALPAQLSGGEMQRVAVARALAHRPPLVLADEPTGNLDSDNGAAVLRLIVELTEESGSALLLVTHSEEAAAVCHRRLDLRDGALVREES